MTIKEKILEQITEEIANYDWESKINDVLFNLDFEELIDDELNEAHDLEDLIEAIVREYVNDEIKYLDIESVIRDVMNA